MIEMGRRAAQTSISMVLSVGLHVLVAAVAVNFNAKTKPVVDPEFVLTEVEIPPPPEPQKIEEPPEVEPPKVEPEPVEPPPKPKLKPKITKPVEPPKPVKDAPVADNPIADEPPPPLRIDQSNTVQDGNSGVSVNTGNPEGTPGGTGKTGSQGKGSRPADSIVGGENAQAWTPQNELFIQQLPNAINVPERPCPAVDELGVEGEVVLTVQVRRNGKVREVRLVKGMGYGCDKIAIKALREAKFKPAIATDGQPTDYELRYTYEFELTE